MKKVFKALTPLTGLLLANPVYAQPTIGIPRNDNFKIDDLGLLISRALGLGLLIAGILVFIYLVWGGIQWITSGGDKGKTEEARSRITAALLGLAIVAAAWAIMQLVAFFFGIDILGGGTPIEPAYD
jgi:hypothetical protein